MSIVSRFKKQYFPLNTIEISSKKLLHNYYYLAKMVREQRIAPVLKSNAYGHGIVEIAKILDSVGAPFFCVDSLHEAYQLMRAHIKTPILIMGYIQPENLRVKKLPFSYAVYSREMLAAIKKYQPHAGIHIFVDTRMHREGVPPEEVAEFIETAQKLRLTIEGLMSHFGMGGKPTSAQTRAQVLAFQKTKELFKTLGVMPKYIHIAASSASLHAKEYPQGLGNVSRIGIALYGINPDGNNASLMPVLRMQSTIAQIKNLRKGDAVGYDFTFVAKKDMKMAIVPMGYNDGINRKLSNIGYVLAGEKFCKILGRVSMNITVIDVTDVPNIAIGSAVTIYSSNPKDKNSIQKVSNMCGVIPYEIFVQLHASTKRVTV